MACYTQYFEKLTSHFEGGESLPLPIKKAFMMCSVEVQTFILTRIKMVAASFSTEKDGANPDELKHLTPVDPENLDNDIVSCFNLDKMAMDFPDEVFDEIESKFFVRVLDEITKEDSDNFYSLQAFFKKTYLLDWIYFREFQKLSDDFESSAESVEGLRLKAF